MPHGSVTATVPATSADVFALLHDYDRRLEWDTLLTAAYLTGDYTQAQVGATCVCKGRALLGGVAMETQYVSFKPPLVAAVRMINRPPFFEAFAATIRHRDVAEGRSEIEYKYNFTARPWLLRWALHPIMAAIFRYETKKRLKALAAFFANRERAAAVESAKAGLGR